MHVPINVKSPNNIGKWQMGFNSAFKGLMLSLKCLTADGTEKYTTIIRLLFEIWGSHEVRFQKTALFRLQKESQ
jgi:hypothetical protein